MTLDSRTRIFALARSRANALSLALLAALAYIPTLASSPGRMPADTKLYLYLDPGGLLGRSTSTFEPDQFAGWVPHQQITYLWPSGPWFWFFDTLGTPDWIAHRLWLGTILFAAGAGARWAAKQVGLTGSAALTVALIYQLSPFLLPYISRTSLLLLPWAGLGWIVALTIRATRSDDATDDRDWRSRLRPWHEPAIIALIVATVGSVNATALALIVPGPVLWLIHAAWQRQVTWRRATGIALRVGVLSLAASAWWIAMLIVQSKHGAPVLAFSETLGDVSRNSTGSEVFRSLGYWLFYQRNPIGPTTSTSLDYLVSVWAMALSYGVILFGLVGLARVSWGERRFAALLVVTGFVLAVGVHPIDGSSPLMALVANDDGSGLALALRSSTRATPVFLLGVALGAGALIQALPARSTAIRPIPLPSMRTLAAVGIGLMALFNLPALWEFSLVDEAIDRDQDLPAAWTDAAAALDAGSTQARVLQLPGAEFGAFRWGYTTDQPLVALTDKAVLTRDLLPLGSAAAMDLLYALDDRFQEGTIEPAAVAPLARLLGADTIWLTNDMAFERFRTARPEVVEALLTEADADVGLSPSMSYGEPQVNTPAFPMVDPEFIASDVIGQPIAPVTLIGVEDPLDIIRAKTNEVMLSGSGDGIVDAASAGLLTGSDLLRYTASLEGADLDAALAGATMLIVTDSNRDRAHHWRGSQDVHGHTEPGGPNNDVLDTTGADQRLQVFDQEGSSTQTIAIQVGPVTAIASSYGEPFAYLPETRAVNAIDGNLDTAWSVGDHGDPLGEHILLDVTGATESLVLHQLPPAPGGRSIATVRVTVDDLPTFDVDLGPDSLGPNGQVVAIPALEESGTVDIEIAAITPGDPQIAASRAGVGFTEIEFGLGPTEELIRPPTDALSQATDVPLSIVFTRLRVDAANPWRNDPEPELRRIFDLPAPRDLTGETTLRIDARTDDAALAELLSPATSGNDVPLADRRLPGAPQARGAASVDGDPATAWITPFDDVLGATLRFESVGDVGSTLTMRQLDGEFSTITALSLSNGETSIEVPVPATSPGQPSTIEIPAGMGGGALEVSVAAIDPQWTIDRRYGDVMTLPAAIAELSETPGIETVTFDPDASITAECSPAYLTLDGDPVSISYTASAGSVLAGEPISATWCDSPAPLAGGDHQLVSATPSTGLTVDRVVLTDSAAESAIALAADEEHAILVAVDRDDPRHRTVTVSPCPDGCWLVLGEGYNDAWSASTIDVELDGPVLVDGGFNGWRLPPSDTPTVVELEWTAQGPVTWGLRLSALTVLACLGLAFGLGRGPRPGYLAPPPRLVRRLRLTSRRHAITASIVLLLSCGLLIAPVWAAVAVIPAALLFIPGGGRRASWLRARPFEVVGLAAGATMAVWALLIERRERLYPDAGWTLNFDHLNGLAVFAIIVLAAGTLLAPDASIAQESSPDPE